jgi:hypothetical protein
VDAEWKWTGRRIFSCSRKFAFFESSRKKKKKTFFRFFFDFFLKCQATFVFNKPKRRCLRDDVIRMDRVQFKRCTSSFSKASSASRRGKESEFRLRKGEAKNARAEAEVEAEVEVTAVGVDVIYVTVTSFRPS